MLEYADTLPSDFPALWGHPSAEDGQRERLVGESLGG
jgi:hypothetical protein